MLLNFDTSLAEGYSNPSQRTRVLTEDWVDRQVYCPNCGYAAVDKFSNNKPAADFFCANCEEQYELKSKKTAVWVKVIDGAYRTMTERIKSG